MPGRSVFRSPHVSEAWGRTWWALERAPTDSTTAEAVCELDSELLRQAESHWRPRPQCAKNSQRLFAAEVPGFPEFSLLALSRHSWSFLSEGLKHGVELLPSTGFALVLSHRRAGRHRAWHCCSWEASSGHRHRAELTSRLCFPSLALAPGQVGFVGWNYLRRLISLRLKTRPGSGVILCFPYIRLNR